MCSERGGSNLLTRLLAAHPLVCGPSPCHVARVLLDHADRYGALEDEQRWQAAVTDAHAVFTAKLGRWSIDGCTPGDVAEWSTSRTLLGLAEGLAAAEVRATGARLVLMKVNRSWRHLDAFLAHFPGLQVVGQVRDPRDMALSWARAPALRGGLPRASRIWRDDQAGLREAAARLAPAGRLRWHRYEELVERPEAVVSGLWEWLGLPSHAAPRWSQGAVVGGGEGSTMWANLSRPIMAGNSEKWRTVMSLVEQRYVEDAVGPLLEWAGYAASGAPAIGAEDRSVVERAERFEKEEFQRLPAEERARLAGWAAVVRRISEREVVERS
jgi:hypothetical protein